TQKLDSLRTANATNGRTFHANSERSNHIVQFLPHEWARRLSTQVGEAQEAMSIIDNVPDHFGVSTMNFRPGDCLSQVLTEGSCYLFIPSASFFPSQFVRERGAYLMVATRAEQLSFVVRHILTRGVDHVGEYGPIS